MPTEGDVFAEHTEFHMSLDILNLELKNKIKKSSSS